MYNIRYFRYIIPVLLLLGLSIPVNAQFIGGSGGGGVGTSFGTSTLFATSYGVKADTKFSNADASWTNAANPCVITTTASDPAFTSADTGKTAFGVGSTGLVTAPLGTLTYISATSASINQACTATASSNGRVVWGTDDTTALVATDTALQALPYCGSVQFPAGYMLVSKGIFNVQPANCHIGSHYTGASSGIGIYGRGLNNTVFIPMPGFDFSTCVASGCFFSPNSGAPGGYHFRDFSINGMTQSLSGVSTSPATYAMTLGNNSYLENVGLIDWATATSSSFFGINLSGQSDTAINLQVDNFAKNGGANCSGYDVVIISSFFAEGPSAYYDMTVSSGANCFGYGNAYGPIATNGRGITIAGNYYGFADWLQVPTGAGITTYGLVLQSGGNAYLYGEQLRHYNGTPSGTFNALYFQTGSGTVYSNNSQITGGATGNAITGDASAGTLVSNGDVISGAIGFTGKFSGPSTLNGSCTGTASASTTLGLFGLGQVSAQACTSTTVDIGVPINTSGTILGMRVTSSAGGVNSSSGVFTVRKNGSNTTITCTMGTATSCADWSHALSVTQGDIISVQFTTQGSETLANPKVVLLKTP